MKCCACLVLFFAASFAFAVRAQDSATALRTRIPECAVYSKDGPFVPTEFYADGVLRFTYLYEPPSKNPGEYDYRDGTHNVYVVFWNPARTKGELLQFQWLRRTEPIHLRVVNNGRVVTRRGKLDIEDTLWGVWTHEHLMRRLVRLETLPLQTMPFKEVLKVGATCDSYARAIDDLPSEGQRTPQ